MTCRKLTPWFVNGQAPAYPGVYNVSCRKEDQSGAWYARWDGKTWRAISLHVERAARYKDKSAHNFHTQGSWRGLAENPESKKE